MERKEMLKKLASYALVIGILTGSSGILSGCNNNVDNDIQDNSFEDNKYDYYVSTNDNNAIIYKPSSYKIYTYSSELYLRFEDKTIVLDNYIGYRNYTISEVEEQVRALIGADGNISYYGFDEEKTLKKTR